MNRLDWNPFWIWRLPWKRSSILSFWQNEPLQNMTAASCSSSQWSAAFELSVTTTKYFRTCNYKFNAFKLGDYLWLDSRYQHSQRCCARSFPWKAIAHIAERSWSEVPRVRFISDDRGQKLATRRIWCLIFSSTTWNHKTRSHFQRIVKRNMLS